MPIHWPQIIQNYGRSTYRTIWKILRNSSESEDVLQEVFLEAFSYSRTQSIRDWGHFLRRVATCRAIDRLRQQAPQTNRELSLNQLPTANADPAGVAIVADLEQKLYASLQQLPPREAQVFCLRYFDQLGNQEIAQILDLSITAVSSALERAREKLRLQLDLEEGRPA